MCIGDSIQHSGSDLGLPGICNQHLARQRERGAAGEKQEGFRDQFRREGDRHCLQTLHCFLDGLCGHPLMKLSFGHRPARGDGIHADAITAIGLCQAAGEPEQGSLGGCPLYQSDPADN